MFITKSSTSHPQAGLYFTAVSGDLDNELSKIEKAGGKVTIQKTKISDDHGFMAKFIDTEGNGIAIHSRK